MANKKALLGGQHVKVEQFSGFDKSRFNAFTAPLGAIVPFVKQLLLPGSFDLKVAISASLPPLATDAFLRSHLKVEAFFVPLRLCYGGFASWFANEKVASVSHPSSTLSVAKLPRLKCLGAYTDSGGVSHSAVQSTFNSVFGPHTLMDYFGVKYPLLNGNVVLPSWADPQISGYYNYTYFNIFPFISYALCYDHWYRNKLIERPLFCPPDASYNPNTDHPAFLPFVSFSNIQDFKLDFTGSGQSSDSLLNGSLRDLRYRNYGYDYFTTALPSAQDGSPMSVDTSAGSFTISALRLANAGQRFAELNQLASPDYRQVNKARYGVMPSSVVAQRPVLLGSADFPMFTSGVEQTAQGTGGASTGNPFAGIASRYGRAHAEGSDFVCMGQVDEPGYLMVMCSLVPEANYAIGISHDMRIFTKPGSIVDLPNHVLEIAGMEPILSEEVGFDDSADNTGQDIFGYQPRYMWHKAGPCNEVHGLFRQGASLQSFIPQRLSSGGSYFNQINTAFLKVAPGDLDNITAVSAALSSYGVMIDSRIDLSVSEPLSESVLPSLVDPAYEHGRDVYLKRGGISVD